MTSFAHFVYEILWEKWSKRRLILCKLLAQHFILVYNRSKTYKNIAFLPLQQQSTVNTLEAGYQEVHTKN